MDFPQSEQYRKYLIAIHLENMIGYTVWGTDMANGEMDKLLVADGKLLLFSSIEKLKNSIRDFVSPFLDIENYENWINENDFSEAYNTYDFLVFLNFTEATLIYKKQSLALLDCINLVQDLFIQLEDAAALRLFEQQEMADLKDYIYYNHFWKKDEEYKVDLNSKTVATLLKETYSMFLLKTQMK